MSKVTFTFDILLQKRKSTTALTICAKICRLVNVVDLRRGGRTLESRVSLAHVKINDIS